MSRTIELFPEGNIIGSFKGFAERGMEFAAELVVPYSKEEIDQPQLGNFILVELSTSKQASLGRITKILPSGMLASAEGENYIERMRIRKDEIPKDLKERMLKYRVQIKLLGVLRDHPFGFMPSQRRLPHLGARVAWPSNEVLIELCKLGGGETDIGHFALGEFIYSGASGEQAGDQFVRLNPSLKVTFDVNRLVARRTAVFARAGYGKSNLMKYLVSELYRKTPKTNDQFKRPVGMLIFDADGEYFWPDNKKRPGLCDMPHLADHIVVYSNRPAPDDHYKNWLAGNIKINLAQLKAQDVFSIALTPDRQDQQNVIKLKAIKGDKWKRLIATVAENGMSADFSEVGELLGYSSTQVKTAIAEINAALSNVNFVVNMLHDPNSTLVDGALKSLSQGKIVIVDVSLLSAKGGEVVAGLLMRKIFSKNQEEFTGGSSLPVIAVIEEAQRVLGGRLNDTSPFVEWVKEGRKYDLGAVMVTQQPGSISGELLSQVDNWFCFHLLSEGDAGVLGKYNSHFSSDILSHMIAEPIRGNCFMWSAPDQPFVLPVRVHEFKVDAGGGKREPIKAAKRTIDEALQEKHREMSKKLAVKICEEGRERKLGLKDFPDKYQGVKTGKLYFLIKKSVQISESEIDHHKEPLFRGVLGECDVREDLGIEYFCAPKTAWDNVLKEK